MRLAGLALFLVFLAGHRAFGAQVETTVKSAQERENTYSTTFVPPEQQEKGPTHCDSFKEFKEAYELLLKDGDLALGEERAARLALRISRGCNGAAQRFFKSYQMMKKTGVALTKAVEVGMEFSLLDDERLKNFNEVFAKMYLENYFDFDFATAYHVSFELSRDYDGKAQDVREDFIKLVKFCTSNDKAALPLRQCAELALKLVSHTPKFPGGLYPHFEKFYTLLRTDKRIGLSVMDAMNLIPKVFAYGPKAPENFRQGLDYATGSRKITIDHKNSIHLALRLAKYSLPLEEDEGSKQELKEDLKEELREISDKK